MILFKVLKFIFGIKMCQSFFVLTIFIAGNLLPFAQATSPASNEVYLELGGIGGYGSINYERIVLTKVNFQLGARIGLSTLKLKDYRNEFNPDIIIPMAINMTYGTKHNVELGFGNTYSSNVEIAGNLSPKRTSNFHGNLHFGYRYQKKDGGLIFRCGYTPLFEFYKSIHHWAGISVGYLF